ncbi:MAG: glucans biosynthesis glucosyltransferase MdoH [Pseudomonadota bacterium]
MSLADLHRFAAAPSIRRPTPFAIFAILTGVMTCAIVGGFTLGIAEWNMATLASVPLIALTAIWISGGAATAIIGLAAPTRRVRPIPQSWTPTAQTAILVTLCGEDPKPSGLHLAALRKSLNNSGLEKTTTIFVLSDTAGTAKAQAEETIFAALHSQGVLNYRRRAENIGRQPGNIADWLAHHGDNHAYMMVLDADSRMTSHRIRRMIWQLERSPRLGLLQAGIALVPGATRFGRHQRIASRLLSGTFGRGFAAWTGDSGNYWGHNAIMRVAAFRTAATLPSLSGTAPFGGDLLSHDFIEAAWIRRTGWTVALDPDASGSCETAPQTLGEFHRRDRRWCQGNLQHLRLLTEPGLSALSRLHLALGILSYLVAPVWLILIGLIASGAVTVTGVLPLALVACVLMVPKLCALIDWLSRARTLRRRWVGLRAWSNELIVSSLIAPLVMLRQTAAVASICLGQDCGWKSGKTPRWTAPVGSVEACIGAGFLSLAWFSGGTAALWLLPVLLPLCGAPLISRAMNAPV